MRSTWKKWMAGVAVATTAVLVLSGCSGGARGRNGGGDKEQTLTIAAPFDVASFDIAQLDTGTQVQYWQAVYDTLLRVDPDGTLTPNMATEYSYNDDNTVLTVKLRKGITFSDGTKFTGDVVKANVEYLKQGTGVAVYMVQNVAEVAVVDDLTVEFHLSAPDPAFTYYFGLVAGAMASPEAFGTESIATTPVGSGPYLLDSKATIRGSEYTFVRNPDYWNAKAYPYDKYVVKPMQDVTARLNAIKSGQANATDIDTSVLGRGEVVRARNRTDQSQLGGTADLRSRGQHQQAARRPSGAKGAQPRDRRRLHRQAHSRRQRHAVAADLQPEEPRVHQRIEQGVPVRPEEGEGAARGGGVPGRLRGGHAGGRRLI